MADLMFQNLIGFWGVIKIEGMSWQKTISHFKIKFEYHLA